ncbi:MAG TPA: alpha/beta fold hydrolase [Chloroflexota bacterium]|nr:alpha/beta fold hydrolase [Chloroflexota bacterium]
MPDALIRGRRVHYERAGSGPLVVLLHGIGGGVGSWREQFAALADAFTLVAWDLPEWPGAADGTPTMADYADDLAAFLDHLQATSAHLLGISMGGVLALEFYGRHPARVRSLVLADTYRGGGTMPEPERSARLARRLAASEGRDLADMARERAPQLFSPHADPALVREAAATMAAIPPAGYRQRAIALAHADTSAVLPHVAVPTLVIWGDQDSVLPCADSEALRDGIRGAALVILPGAGHASNQERPAEFNAAVRRFWRAH